jgi:hypothetical protein
MSEPDCEKQEPCGYPQLDCVLGVYITKCEDRIEALNAKIERMWDALEYVDAHIDLEEHISEEFAETVRVLLWEKTNDQPTT